MPEFNDEEYTADSIIEELSLVERHATDGSVLDAGCHCVEGKHLYRLSGLASEGVSIMAETKKKEFLSNLAALTRALRRNMESDKWDMRAALHESGLNPEKTRAYLPHGLTSSEHASSFLRKQLSSCVRKAEISCCGKHTTHYEGCRCNPVAVCRASLER